MKPKHKKAQSFCNKGLFSNLNRFADLENRISALPHDERGDAFEVFAEAYFIMQRISQAIEVWPDKLIPPSLRTQLGLPPVDKGIDGIFKTSNGDLIYIKSYCFVLYTPCVLFRICFSKC